MCYAGNELEKALRKIARPDVIRKCMKNIEDVTDDDEKQLAKERLGIGTETSFVASHSELPDNWITTVL